MKDLLLIDILWENVKKFGEREALYFQDRENKWQPISWKRFGELVQNTSKAFLEIGISSGDRVGIISRNMPEWTIVDYAIQNIGAVSVPLFASISETQASYILEETQCSLVIAGEQEQYDLAVSLAGKLSFIKNILALAPDVVLSEKFSSFSFSNFAVLGNNSKLDTLLRERSLAVKPDDLYTIIYTSGTSGEQKGVMLHFYNILECIDTHQERLEIGSTDISLAFLPLSHVFERGWTTVALSVGMTIYYLKNPRDVIDAIKEVKPTIMCSVPRFYEKTYAGIQNAIEHSSIIKKWIFNWGISIGARRTEYTRLEKPVPIMLKMAYRLADKLVFEKGRDVLGGRIKFMPCAGAPLSEEIVRFFHYVGITITYGYGLTETTATVSCFPKYHFKFGSVGKIMPGLDVKIGDNEEIMVKGRTVMSGYYKKPDATAAVFKDGWFCTGDAGWVDEDGHIYLKDRIKDIMKTSSGKYIAPQMVETLIGKDRFIEHIAIIGNERKYVTALIVPAFEVLYEFAHHKSIKFEDRIDLLKHKDVLALYHQIVHESQKELSVYEQVKKITLLANEFTIHGGELTSTLKIRRKIIAEKYRNEIESMYPGD